MSKYQIDSSTLTGIADAVREMRREIEVLTPAQIQSKIEASKIGLPHNMTIHVNPTTEEWERPNDWPDIDALANEITGDQDCLYLTYDLRKTPGYGWIGVYATTSDKTSWTVDRGHISNGEFVSDATFSVAHGNYFRQTLDDTYGNVQLWKVSSAGHIVTFGFCANTSTTVSNFNNNMQPCVQRAGTLPWCKRWAGTIGTGYNATSGGTIWLQRDAIVPGKLAVVTDLSNCWQNCYSLQSLDLSKWDTSNWAVTLLSSCWNNCYLIKNIDISKWDTRNWAVTNLSNCWSSCFSLETLDLSEWDTSNWAVTNFGSTWYLCYSLKELIVPFNTSNWTVNTLVNTWNYCYSLKNLDLSGWNTKKWNVTTLSGTWYGCYSLQTLKISNWDTSNWQLTSLNNTLRGCEKLLSMDLSKWDTTKWVVATIADWFRDCYSMQSIKVPSGMTNCVVTTMVEAFYCCWSLEELDLNVWNTTNWGITTFASMFYGCYSLKTLKINEWNTTNWNVTSLAGCWNSCWSLTSLNLTWNTTNWAVTSFTSVWNNCYSLITLNVPWDTSNWAVTSLSTTWNACYSLKSLSINSWDTSNWAVTSLYSCWSLCTSLEVLNIGSWDTSNWNLTDTRTAWNAMYSMKTANFPSSFNFSTTSTQNNSIPVSASIENFNGIVIYVNHNWSGAFKLTKQSLINILNKLPTVTAARTITLSQINKLKLTTEEIAVATQKGWTVA